MSADHAASAHDPVIGRYSALDRAALAGGAIADVKAAKPA